MVRSAASNAGVQAHSSEAGEGGDSPLPARRPPQRPSAKAGMRAFVAVGRFLLVLAAGLTTWEALSRAGLISDLVLPAPSDIGSSLIAVVTSSPFGGHVRLTLSALALGYALAMLSGLLIGAIFGLVPLLKKTFYPYIIFVQSIPKIALVPLFVTWLGFGISSKVAMATVVAFFPIFINTMSGLSYGPPDSLLLLKSLDASRTQTIRKVLVPNALPTIFAGAKTSLTFAFLGTIVGEFQGARGGLGYLIQSYAHQIRVDRVFAIIIILACMSLTLYGVIGAIEARAVRWARDTTGEGSGM